MNDLPANVQNLFDEYLEGTITAERLGELEGILQIDAPTRAAFVRYAQLHTDLHVAMRADRLAAKTLATLPALPSPSRSHWWWASALAASVLVALGAGWWLGSKPPAPEPIAWVVNAQNCQWTNGTPTTLLPGTQLELASGLVEVRFRSGATVILDGPARVELLSANSGQVHQGRITARVPEQAIGFELLSPEGKIIDLGTEFGMTVHPNGMSDVYVFEGEIEAYPIKGSKLLLTQAQAGSLSKTGVQKVDAAPGEYVRVLTPAPKIAPQTRVWDFQQPVANTITDRRGQGIGLTHRLKGTGKALLDDDANLFLNPARGLELTTTNSDLNLQFRLTTGEYFGLKLADYGFTGDEDFEFSADFPHIPALQSVGQFGLYVGTSSSRNIRGGLISKGRGNYRQFLVNNADGEDVDLSVVGLLSTGDDLRIVLRRVAGKFSMTIENRTAGTSSTLTTKHPDHLDNLKDLHVGIFGANTQSDESKTLVIRQASLTIWKATK